MALSMGYGLVQDQRMKLVMTPELRQAIQVLQLSAVDLIQYIQDQAIENPVLEMEDSPRMAESEPVGTASVERLADWGAFMRGGGTFGRSSSTHDEEEGHPVDRIADSALSLSGVLEEQLRYLSIDTRTYQICRYIIGNLDEDGYLRLNAEQLCKRFNISEQDFADSLKLVQGLDPAGVGARNLSECLTLQLEREGEPAPLLLNIVSFHLHDLAEGKLKRVAKALDCTTVEVQEAADRIRKLNPKPGLACHGESPRYIFPDVTVGKVQGEWEVWVNEGYIPRLGISTQYERILRENNEGAHQAAAYIKERIQSAMWLLKSIEQRRNTLYRVSRAIIQVQRDFFEHGISHLKPLTLREVAEELELHESTVSRATRHKYIQTPRGLFPFRFFFPSGVSNQSGGNTSARSVKERIEQLIKGENKGKPLSDQKIADRLREAGIRISRRTVAKYREEMGITSSQARRRFDS
ncbi:RNA polymerase factor sigma-54 [Kroppenstedtia eburnea]|uniref:RNA polymerase, sigma 54 subunit, RpoN/SigL n=1 Tax=Kroppenstedtia eburnea TaxID=714067 RepID=A0A1N7JY10_9BACL|nr:RNA polymerase factor sigma-54 [Kroppenstedtia eburnea]QKI83392.1 RNA polymerase factor sigma-54 [Kroppenstedtia eburnea]SIS54225.1 RNA polymerase, sigma 54 subunit, RpoN/SigL [Kroppenstedtia eburnea]